MRLVSLLFALAAPVFVPLASVAQPAQTYPAPAQTLQVYPGRIPGAQGHAPADDPRVDVYLPASNPTRSAVLVIPGGGYSVVVDTYEGAGPAQWLNQHGVAAFVLHYRVRPYRYPYPIQDGERAMRLVRSRAADFGFDPGHLGVWGFSAGGHLAAVISTLFDDGSAASSDPVERISDRPDFSILAYPVISMKTGITHPGSQLFLLGPTPDPALVALLSTEDHVTPRTPPAFVFNTDDDDVVPAQNSLLYVAACQKAGVPVEFHMFEHGPHGVGLAQGRPTLSIWPTLLANWMRRNGWMAGGEDLPADVK